MSAKLILIIHNVRSAHNVGSMLRTAEGLGINEVYITGYTPYPVHKDDKRLPHIAKSTDTKISKTALGAEKTQKWRFIEDAGKLVLGLKKNGWTIAGLEQAAGAFMLPGFKPPQKLAIIVGNEVSGINKALLSLCDLMLEIPMSGEKESFNVAEAAAIAMYHCRYKV